MLLQVVRSLCALVVARNSIQDRIYRPQVINLVSNLTCIARNKIIKGFVHAFERETESEDSKRVLF